MKVSFEIISNLDSKIENDNIEVDTRSLELDIANSILKLAKTYAPVKTGYMRDNIEIIDDAEGIRIASLAPYSIYVHEILGKYHKEPTKAKFLEDAAYEVYNSRQGDFDASIEYKPLLQVFINSNRGVNIAKKKQKEKEDIESIFNSFRS